MRFIVLPFSVLAFIVSLAAVIAHGMMLEADKESTYCSARGYPLSFVGKWGEGCGDEFGHTYFNWQIEKMEKKALRRLPRFIRDHSWLDQQDYPL